MLEHSTCSRAKYIITSWINSSRSGGGGGEAAGGALGALGERGGY